MNAIRLLSALALGAFVAASPSLAQTTVTRSETTTSGKVVRLLIAPNLKLDCTNGPLPEIKVTSAPKNGSLITKAGKLKTPPRFRCPNKDAAAQAVFYQSRADFTGADSVTLEIKTPDGTLQSHDIRITVEAGKKEDSKDTKEDQKDKLDL